MNMKFVNIENQNCLQSVLDRVHTPNPAGSSSRKLYPEAVMSENVFLLSVFYVPRYHLLHICTD